MRTPALTIALMLATSLASGQDGCLLPGEGPSVAAGGYYVVVDACPIDACLYSVWVYEETNGLEGLQRGDAFIDTSCEGHLVDTIVAGHVEPAPA